MATLAPLRVKTDGKIISITVFNFHKYIEVNYYSYVILHDLLVWSIRLFGLLCSPRVHSFDQKYSTNSIIVKYYCTLKIIVFYLNKLSNVIYSCDAKLNL